jgi:ParB-like chromosome segregation protein Spo0J
VLTVEEVPIDAVRPHPRNAWVGDVDEIANSIQLRGQYVPIVVQRSTGYIIKGNHTWKACSQVGMDTIDVVYRDVHDATAAEDMLFDNKIAQRGHYVDADLAALLGELDTLERTGWKAEELDDLLLKLTPRSLDEMAGELGEHDPEGVWPHLRIKLSPSTKARVEAWWSGLPGNDDEAKARALLAWWPSSARIEPA